jgi:hypothetical protein
LLGDVHTVVETDRERRGIAQAANQDARMKSRRQGEGGISSPIVRIGRARMATACRSTIRANSVPAGVGMRACYLPLEC